MSPHIPLRITILLTRLLALALTGASLGYFAIVLSHVFNLPANSSPVLSCLPVIALSISIFWNTVSLLTLTLFSRYKHVILDTLVSLILLILGTIGFAHDDTRYLGNAYYLESSDDWLMQEITGGSLMLAALIVQMVLVLLNFTSARKQKSMNGKKELHPYAAGYDAGYAKGLEIGRQIQMEKEVDFELLSVASTQSGEFKENKMKQFGA